MKDPDYEPHAAAADARPSRKCSAYTCVLGMILVAGLVMILFLVVFDGDTENLPVDLLQGIFDQDPFEGVAPEDAARWPNQGNGVMLDVVNALDPRWHDMFNMGISDWDNGYPDSLTLVPTVAMIPDPECSAIQGVVKVCNSNYGATPWKGQAEVFINQDTNTILAASARLNEYYLTEKNRAEMQYAMCHELGHTWGVHHTDENFNNRDLGNCMDYTNRHSKNLHPDFSNFKFLHALYGLVPGAQPYAAPTTTPQVTAPTPAPAPPIGGGVNLPTNGNTDQKEDKKDKKDKGDRRILHAPDFVTDDWLNSVLKVAREQGWSGETPLEGGIAPLRDKPGSIFTKPGSDSIYHLSCTKPGLVSTKLGSCST